MLKIGNCYIARFNKMEMPVRIESQKENGVWLARSLTHGRVVFVRSEKQLLRECCDHDLAEYAKTVQPNRRSKKEAPAIKMPADATPLPQDRKSKKRRPPMPPQGLTLLEAAHKILRDARKPMTCQQIVERAVQKKYTATSGVTPHFTLHSAMSREIAAKGKDARFVKAGRGLFAAR